MFYKILNFLKYPEHIINDLLETVGNPLNIDSGSQNQFKARFTTHFN